MPFNFPIEQNRFGDLFAQGIANAINTYRQGQQIQRQKQLDEQQKTLGEYQNPGLHFGAPPKTPPVNLIDTAPVPSVQRTPDGTPMDQYFRDTVGSAVKSPPAITGTHPSRIDLSGGYFDPDEAMQIMAPRMALAGREAFLKSLNETAGKLAGDPGVIAARDATSALARARANYYETQANKPPTPHFVQDEKGNFVAINPQTLQPTPLGIRGKTTPPPSQFTFLPGVDANGKPVTVRGNTKTGDVSLTDVGRPVTGQGGVREQAQIATAQQQVAEADKIMRKFEADLLSGKRTISTSGAALAKIALSGGALTSSAAEAALNKTDPDLAAYVRAAKAVASAERLITPRGGSNSLMQAEGMLSGAGPHANADLVRQAQAYRNALVQGLMSHNSPQNAPQEQPDSIASKYGIHPVRQP